MQIVRPLFILAALSWRWIVLVDASVSSSSTPRAAARPAWALFASSTHRRRTTTPNTKTTTARRITGFRPHAVYTCHMKLPLVGTQSFRLQLINDRTAHFTIVGAVIRLQDSLGYTLNRTTGTLTLTAQPATVRCLTRFGLTLHSAVYLPASDAATLCVRSRVLGGTTVVRLHFQRTHARRTAMGRKERIQQHLSAWASS